jgi:hypothetical protein
LLHIDLQGSEANAPKLVVILDDAWDDDRQAAISPQLRHRNAMMMSIHTEGPA